MVSKEIETRLIDEAIRKVEAEERQRRLEANLDRAVADWRFDHALGQGRR